MKLPLVILFSLFFLLGCLKFNHADYSQVPIVPPSRTYLLNIPGLNVKHTEVQTTNSNWFTAYSKIEIWLNFISNNISTPYSMLDSLRKVDIEYFADNTWIRNNTFQNDSSNIEAFLYSTIEADTSILWELFFSVNNNDPFVSLQAYTSQNKSQGYWSFYKYVFKPIYVLKIDWIVTDTSLRVIYSNVYESGKNYGDKLSIEYLSKTNNSSVYNILIEITNNNQISTSKIEIDSITHQGRIKDSLVFLDTLWHNWDTNFENL